MKKVQLLLVAPNTPETHANMATFLEMLRLDEVSCDYTMDLKLLNILLGLSVSTN